MLTRIVIFAIVVTLAMMLYRKLQAAKRKSTAQPNPAPAMRKCAHCGVHLPEPDALKSGEHYFCSDQHRLSYEKQHSDHD